MRKGRQTLCNINRPNDITADQIVESNSKTIESITKLINYLFRKVGKNSFTSIEPTTTTSINRKNHQPNTKLKTLESVGFLPSKQSSLLQRRHKAQTCRRLNRRSKKHTCTATNQSHVEIRTINATTKTPAPPNCNYTQSKKKTYSNSVNDDNCDCINSNNNKNNKTNNKQIHTHCKSEWYIELASNCYRNGFQSHVNHLDECSKHSSVHQRNTAKIVLPSFLRLPSSAFISSHLLQSTPTHSIQSIDRSVSSVNLIPDLVRCSSSSSLSESITIAAYCDKNYSNYSFSDNVQSERRPSQLNNDDDEKNRIYCKKRAPHHDETLSSVDHYNHRWSIEENSSRLSIIGTIPIARQPTQPKPFNSSNDKNNMNSNAIDADHLQQNLQLSTQTIQHNYPNNNCNNFTFNREHQILSGQQEQPTSPTLPQTIIENNNYYQPRHHWSNENNIRHPTITTTTLISPDIAGEFQSKEDIVNDLIESFNRSFDVSDANQLQTKQPLPQIILSDFSSEQPTPPTTPIFLTVQNSCIRKLSEHPN